VAGCGDGTAAGLDPGLIPGTVTAFDLITIARTGDRFRDFRPYVASIDERGLVAFQATLASGYSRVFAGGGGEVVAFAGEGVRSHPDLDGGGGACFYAARDSGGTALVMARGDLVEIIAETGARFADIGPLGPAMNQAGAIAFRAGTRAGGAGIFVAGAPGPIVTVAEDGGALAGFEGIPVITAAGAVVFRANLRGGGHGIYRWEDGELSEIARTGERFAELGRFPAASDAGAVAFVATLRSGVSGVFTAAGARIETVLDSRGAFESFRGALLDAGGAVVFYATPRGAQLGIFSGPDPVRDRILAVGDPLDGSSVTAFVLNPVSINRRGQLAIRIELASGEQRIIRADPPGALSD
jgi:hypothetical protein